VVPAATAMVATACLVTALLVPILTAMWSKRARMKAGLSERTDEDTGPLPQPLGAHE